MKYPDNGFMIGCETRRRLYDAFDIIQSLLYNTHAASLNFMRNSITRYLIPLCGPHVWAEMFLRVTRKINQNGTHRWSDERRVAPMM